MAEAVIPRPLIRVAQNFISSGDLLELVLGAVGLVHVRMVLPSKTTIRLFNFFRRCAFRHSKNFVEITRHSLVYHLLTLRAYSTGIILLSGTALYTLCV